MRNAVAVAEEGRDGEVRYLGEIDTTEAATRKLVIKLAAKYRQLTFCYEAGPTGYRLHRLIGKLGHDCIVAAPSRPAGANKGKPPGAAPQPKDETGPI